MSAASAVLVSNDDTNTIVRLVAALGRHGLTAQAVEPTFSDDDVRPQIPVFRFSGIEGQERLTTLLISYYEATELPDDKERDTHLLVTEFDNDVDRNVEFDYELSFNGLEILETLVLMPREIFKFTPKLNRTIEQRYYAKLDRFATFLDGIDPST